jgi:hypothetical protein
MTSRNDVRGESRQFLTTRRANLTSAGSTSTPGEAPDVASDHDT